MTLRFQSGNLIRDLQVIYDNGLIPFTTLATEGWTDYPIVNGLGMLFNRIGNKDIGSTPAAGDKSLPWSTTSNRWAERRRDSILPRRICWR